MKMPAAVALVVFVGIAGEAAAQTPQLTPPQFVPMDRQRVCFGTVNIPPVGQQQQCSGKVYPSGLAPATDAYLILAIDELRRVSGLLQQLIQSESSVVTSMNNLSTTTANTQTLWTSQATAFAKVITDTITDRFNQLPLTIMQDAAFKKTIDDLRDGILKTVNDKLEAAQRNP